jgi:uncharacterized protein
MNPTRNKRMALALAAGLAAAFTVAPATAAEKDLRVETGGPGSSVFVFTTTMQTVMQRDTDYRMNVTSGATSTRSTLDAAHGNVDFFISSPPINDYMKTGTSMFADIKDAPELFKNIRSVINFPLGPYHVLTFADSGIKTLADVRGKKVFLGPPGAAASNVGLAILESAGLKEDVDYERSKLDWTSGGQAFQDRHVDVAIFPTELPSPVVSQYALLSNIRLLDIPQSALESAPVKAVLATPGRDVGQIPAGIYGKNQVNEGPVNAIGSWVGIGTQKDEPEDVVYAVTKAIFDNIDTFHNAADWMKSITPETALNQMNAPLHPGALKYFREIGVDVPDALVPPEAK